MPEQKDYISVTKGVHNQKLSNLQKSCNLQGLHTASKEKHTNVNIEF